jgi:hypothetical protein
LADSHWQKSIPQNSTKAIKNSILEQKHEFISTPTFVLYRRMMLAVYPLSWMDGECLGRRKQREVRDEQCRKGLFNIDDALT